MNNSPSLGQTLDQTWQILTQPGTRHMVVLATTDEDGAPQARMVALRHCDRTRAIMRVYTDIKSFKIKGLQADPRVSILLWLPDDLQQLRLSGTAEILTGNPALWDQVPNLNREAYGHMPPPGTPIASSDDWSIAPSPDRFGVLEIRLSHIDAVSLDPKGHRRAEFHQHDNWQGRWLSP